jgi:hypothetical protein
MSKLSILMTRLEFAGPVLYNLLQLFLLFFNILQVTFCFHAACNLFCCPFCNLLYLVWELQCANLQILLLVTTFVFIVRLLLLGTRILPHGDTSLVRSFYSLFPLLILPFSNYFCCYLLENLFDFLLGAQVKIAPCFGILWFAKGLQLVLGPESIVNKCKRN